MRPFLKWAGCKYRLLAKIKAVLPIKSRLIEPFVGSGAIFLNTHYQHYLLADANKDLITLFQQLQQRNERFIESCQKYFKPEYNTVTAFYNLRRKFNKLTTKAIEERCRLFIYLNRHGYNGLCRYNSAGHFNVPFGEYAAPHLPMQALQYFQERAKSAEFVCADFTEVMDQAKLGDVVYCDPPYVPLSKTAHFTAYAPVRFDETKQILLANKAIELAKKGIPVVISNHDTKFTRELYKKAKIISFEVRRLISSKGNERNKVKELIAVFD